MRNSGSRGNPPFSSSGSMDGPFFEGSKMIQAWLTENGEEEIKAFYKKMTQRYAEDDGSVGRTPEFENITGIHELEFIDQKTFIREVLQELIFKGDLFFDLKEKS
jgi:hypothetical protein